MLVIATPTFWKHAHLAISRSWARCSLALRFITDVGRNGIGFASFSARYRTERLFERSLTFIPTCLLNTQIDSSSDVKRHDVLVVEDNPDGRDSLKELLESLGHHVIVAADGLEAVRLARETHPDLAIVDLGLPKLDGFEVAQQIRAALGKTVVLVANTGYDSSDMRENAVSAGFDAYLVKPKLVMELDRWLS